MHLARATEDDYIAIVDLANLAFRGVGPAAGWNSEADFIEGQRLTESLLKEDLAQKPNAVLLTYRDNPQGELLGTVWLEPKKDGAWYLGLLTIRPDLQNRHLGRALLDAAEGFARQQGAIRIRMSVVNVRTTLIAWYERRGYVLTGETQPFPYGDQRFGRPLRDDLHFVMLEKDVIRVKQAPESSPAGTDADSGPGPSCPNQRDRINDSRRVRPLRRRSPGSQSA
jgi:ribosomal protein S18 acetylase RimI-like enzyme